MQIPQSTPLPAVHADSAKRATSGRACRFRTARPFRPCCFDRGPHRRGSTASPALRGGRHAGAVRVVHVVGVCYVLTGGPRLVGREGLVCRSTRPWPKEPTERRPIAQRHSKGRGKAARWACLPAARGLAARERARWACSGRGLAARSGGLEATSPPDHALRPVEEEALALQWHARTGDAKSELPKSAFHLAYKYLNSVEMKTGVAAATWRSFWHTLASVFART